MVYFQASPPRYLGGCEHKEIFRPALTRAAESILSSNSFALASVKLGT